jgi:hypothetical protein
MSPYFFVMNEREFNVMIMIHDTGNDHQTSESYHLHLFKF